MGQLPPVGSIHASICWQMITDRRTARLTGLDHQTAASSFLVKHTVSTTNVLSHRVGKKACVLLLNKTRVFSDFRVCLAHYYTKMVSF